MKYLIIVLSVNLLAISFISCSPKNNLASSSNTSTTSVISSTSQYNGNTQPKKHMMINGKESPFLINGERTQSTMDPGLHK